MQVLAFAASLREGSLNRRLVELVARLAERQADDVVVDLAHFRTFDMPLYDGDVEAREGFPPGARELIARIRASDALVIAAPEYNFSIAGPLKNAIDWVSRDKPSAFRGRSVLLVSASPAAPGGIRGLWQTRVPLEGNGAFVFPDMFALAHAHEAFAEDGTLRDAGLQARLEGEVAGFVRLARALRSVCDGSDAQRVIVPSLEHQTTLESAEA